MSVNNSILKSSQKKRDTFSSLNFINRLNNSQNNENNNKTFSTSINPLIENNSEMLSPNSKKLCLFIKKINLKESQNNYYSKAMHNIFFNPKNYLNNIYNGKKVIIGKKYKKIQGLRELYEYYNRINKRRKTLVNKNEMKSLNIFQKVLQHSRSFSLHKNIETYKTNSYNETSRTKLSNTSKLDVKFFPVNDKELQSLYKEIAEREEYNKKQIDKEKCDKNFLNKSQVLGIGQMLNLQEKILKVKRRRSKCNEKLTNKIISKTFKEKDKILMNDHKEILILKEKKNDKDLIKFNISNYDINKNLKNWIFNLRKTKDEEEKSKIKSPQEIIYYNKNFSFSDKNEKSIRKLLFRKISINSKNISETNEEKKMNDISNNKSLSSLRNLFIQGRNLLNQEIKLSKDLVGKKKKIMQYSFPTKDISSMLMAKSHFIDDVITPRAIINSMETHKYI